MATTKPKQKKQRHVTRSEAKRLYDAVDNARRLAWKMSIDERYFESSREYIKSLLKNLQKAKSSMNWARMSNYTFG